MVAAFQIINQQSLFQKNRNTVQCTIHGEPLEAVDHHKFLGAELSSDLNCQDYGKRPTDPLAL